MIKYKFLLLFILFSFSSSAQDTVRIISYNILNYDVSDTSRHQFYRTVLMNSRPDILVTEEILSQNAVNMFRDRVLNTLGAGTFSAGTFINGFDTDNAIFFKTSKFNFISNTPIRTELRDINEFKILHNATLDTLRLYAVHLKANNTTADRLQRAREVDSLRKVTNLLPPGTNFIVLGDFNIYSSTEPAYMNLLQAIPGNEGHFYDMYNLPGTWNSSAYAVYHTQSTRIRQFGGGSTGGMDDRFDMILYSAAVNNSGGITIIQQSLAAYGNDGNHYNDSINRPPNNAVGQMIADALHYASDHLPVSALFIFEGSIGIKPVSNEIPGEYMLFQNYPNPFNPVTKIQFAIPVKGSQYGFHVYLAVYDVLGKEVYYLVNEQLRPGVYEVTFDASNLPSGVYYYRLTAGNYSNTRKMIILK